MDARWRTWTPWAPARSAAADAGARRALEALGVARHAGAGRAWSATRWCWPSRGLARAGAVPRAGGRRAGVGFYRDGDEAALQAALGPCRRTRRGRAAAHLLRLVERSRPSAAHLALAAAAPAGRPAPRRCRCPSCWPPAAARRTAGSTRVTELDTLDGLNSELAFQGYPDSFQKARRLQRQVTLYVGPPNSGKTHAAFERLAQALDGAYLAPLRLLALEGRDRLVARGVPCSLLTGEENVPADGARVVSSTIEMVDTASEHRRGRDRRGADDLRRLARLGLDAGHRGRAGARAHHHLQRLRGAGHREPAGPVRRALQVRASSASSTCSCCRAGAHGALKLGDAVVAFSRRDVLMLRDQIAERPPGVGDLRRAAARGAPPRGRALRRRRATSWWPPTPSAWA
jgi:ATP-dependent RNA helicase SUPV3L1/SUV3